MYSQDILLIIMQTNKKDKKDVINLISKIEYDKILPFKNDLSKQMDVESKQQESFF